MHAPSHLSEKSFGLMFAVVFLIVFGLVWIIGGNARIWLVAVAGAFLGLALVSPIILLPLNRLWSLFAEKFGRFNNFLLLSIFFFLFLLPISLGLRLFGKDPLKRKFDKSAASYFEPVSRKLTADNYSDMF